jgi:prophage regulatory protein
MKKSVAETQTPTETQTQRFLRRPEVCDLTGLKTSTLYEMMQAGQFPRPISISKRLVVWPEHEVAAWQARVAGSRK